MSTRRRLALVLVAAPLALYAWACSSDSTTPDVVEAGGGGGGPTEGGPGFDGSVGPGTDGSTGMDSSMGTDAADASDSAVPVVCIGNPLTADGGNLDGGVSLDAGVTTQIIAVPQGTFLDGPQWLDANGGFLVYSEFSPTPGIRRIGADGGAPAIFRDAGFNATNGPVGNGARGGVLVTAVDQATAGGTAGFFLTAPDGGPAGTLALGDAGATSPNDVIVGPANNLYFTDGQYVTATAGLTGLYRMLPDAAVSAVATNIGRANGIAFSPDNTTLYVGIGPLPGDPDPKAVLAFAVSATGAVTAPGASFLAAADLVDVPDGIAVDVGGNLWIAEAAGNGAKSGRVEVFSPAKKKLGTIPFPDQRPTGVTFGGVDGKQLFITTESAASAGGAGVYTYVSRCAGLK